MYHVGYTYYVYHIYSLIYFRSKKLIGRATGGQINELTRGRESDLKTVNR